MTLGTKQSYAALKGFTKAYLSKAEIKDMLAPAMEKDPADGKMKLNFEKADELFAAHKDPAQPERRGARADEAQEELLHDPDKKKYGEVKTTRELVKLENDQLDLLERKGETLLRREVRDACAAAGQKLQEQAKSVSHQLSQKFASMTDARQIKTMMDEEFRKMFQKMSDDLNRNLDSKGEQTVSTANA